MRSAMFHKETASGSGATLQRKLVETITKEVVTCSKLSPDPAVDFLSDYLTEYSERE